MDAQIIGVIVLLIAIGIFLSFYFNKNVIIKRKLRKAPFKKIPGFKNRDIAKIVGKVEFVDDPLIAPLSNRRCALYHVLIEEQVSSGKSSHWKTIIEENVKNKFVIRDGNYCAFIHEDHLKSYIVHDRKYKSGFLNDATAHLEKYLKKHGRQSEGLFGLNKTIRYKEGILEEGEEIAVLAKGVWKRANELGLPDTYDRVLELTAPTEGSIYISDDPDTVQHKYSQYQR